MSQPETKQQAAVVVRQWVSLYADSLYAWAYHKTSGKETAEDLVQEVFLAALENFDRYQGKSEPKTWLFSILRNKIADYFRASFRRPEQHADFSDRFFDDHERWATGQAPVAWAMHDEENLFDDKDFINTWSRCLEGLPDKWRSSIAYKFLEKKNQAQVCQELNITPTNYWQMLHRAKLQLRKCLESKWFNKT